MTTLMQAHHQWASRPDDERFTSLDELLTHCRSAYERSHVGTTTNRMIMAHPAAATDGSSVDRKGLVLLGLGDTPAAPTHWAFGQLCGLVGAPAGYMRTLPSDLVADCLNQSMLSRKVDTVGWLNRESNGVNSAHAMTGPGYGRIWNKDVVAALVDRFGDGRTGQFTVPGEFGRTVEITKDNTTLFASDQDMFVFLADEHNRIEVPGRRAGQSGSMARGFFIQNSEVGAASLKISTFLFDYVCSNRIVWGADDVKEIAIRHSSGAPLRWLDEIVPALRNYAEKSTHTITDAIAAARAARVDEDKVEEFLSTRFTRTQAKAIRLAHIADEDRPIETMWDAVVGATAYARSLTHQDQRVEIERKAGKILTSASR